MLTVPQLLEMALKQTKREAKVPHWCSFSLFFFGGGYFSFNPRTLGPADTAVLIFWHVVFFVGVFPDSLVPLYLTVS